MSFFSRRRSHSQSKQHNPVRRHRSFERLEERTVLSAFSVVNLNDRGAGSLREAIIDANKHPGADVINFSVAGTITLNSALPKITDRVSIDGNTAPGYSAAPVVEVNNHGFTGLVFTSNASSSVLSSLSIVNAAGSGVSLNGTHGTIIVGNYIGLALNGSTIAANRGNGIELDGATANTIGGITPQDRNVISGNRLNGILLKDSASNAIFGSYIGTDATGSLARANGANGIALTGSKNNIIGAEGSGNVISGNGANGILLQSNSNANTVRDNLIGLNAAGSAALGNALEGVKVLTSRDNLIGQADPVTSITYHTSTDVLSSPAVNAWQGIRGGDSAGQYIVTGTSGLNALLYEGPIGSPGTGTTFLFPGSQQTSAYGPDNLGSGSLAIVGTYKNSDYASAPVTVNGFLFQGTVADLASPSLANFTTVDYPGAKFNYVHSVANGLVVGNYDSPVDHGKGGLPLGPGHAFIYDPNSDTFLTDVVFPNSKNNTVYGIWYNGGTSYTLAGGYSAKNVNNFADQNQPIGQGYMVDYDSLTGKFTHWTSFDYPFGKNFVTHFEGISSVEKGVYTLSADSVQAGTGAPAVASWVTVRRNADGSFGSGVWVNLNYGSGYITTSNSVYGNQVVGIAAGGGGATCFQATISTGFQLSNIISGNGGNGIGLYAAKDNQIAMNYIGTDITGLVDLGNGGNGVAIASNSSNNLIGGEATGGNDPTGPVFVTPPQGNLISGNNANGVSIFGHASGNQLSGNFIGTNATGNAALGNDFDGVKIENADNNSLIGCTFQQDPFVFYNVISGNGGNGLRVLNSDNTTIQANFFGLGADNATPVGNALNGVLIAGSSAHTTMGGPIPLGNVDAANGLNGIVVQDTASYFVSYNTFCGMAAFTPPTTLGNGANGMLITSTGGHNLIRTNIVSANDDDGIEISGSARDVDIVGNIIGLNYNGTSLMSNAASGIKVAGNAHDIVIGGPQPTFNVVPQNTISGNAAYGVDIEGTAHNILVNNGFIGSNVTGLASLGNMLAGINVGAGTYSIAIGSTDPLLKTVISGNTGNGIQLNGTQNVAIQGCYIGVDRTGIAALANGGSGISIAASNNNLIGGPTTSRQNIIAHNAANGVLVQSGSGNTIIRNSIYQNGSPGINLLAGANNNQAASVLSSVATSASGIQVTGSLTSMPNKKFTLEFFANDTSAASGRVFLGALEVQTDNAGLANFTFNGPLPPSDADFITATATDLTLIQYLHAMTGGGNTSEFSNAVS